MKSSYFSRLMVLFILPLLCCSLTGCRRNMMRITSNPPGATVFVEGKIVTVGDADRKAAKKIDLKKTRKTRLSPEEAEFDKNRKGIQGTPIEYEFPSLACGYALRCQKKNYKPQYKIEYLEPRWYEYPPIDLIVDVLPFNITDTREVHFDLVPMAEANSIPEKVPDMKEASREPSVEPEKDLSTQLRNEVEVPVNEEGNGISEDTQEFQSDLP